MSRLRPGSMRVALLFVAFTAAATPVRWLADRWVLHHGEPWTDHLIGALIAAAIWAPALHWWLSRQARRAPGGDVGADGRSE